MIMKPTAAELSIQEKEQLFLGDIEKSKARQNAIIAQCDGGISYAQGQIALQERRKQAAQKLLEELETRYPLEVVE